MRIELLAEHRVGSALVREGMRLAGAMGHRELYAATAHAGGLFGRLGWRVAQTVRHGTQEVTIYRWPGTNRPVPGTKS